MELVDNSEFAWLVYCDWLADHERYTEEQEIRENITNPDTNNWDYEHRFGVGVGVGGFGGFGVGVGVGVGGGVVGGGGRS